MHKSGFTGKNDVRDTGRGLRSLRLRMLRRLLSCDSRGGSSIWNLALLILIVKVLTAGVSTLEKFTTIILKLNVDL